MTTIKLTKAMRQEICEKIMADVPKVDYVTQARELVEKDMYDALPDDVKEFYDKHKELLMGAQVCIAPTSGGTSIWIRVWGYGYSAQIPLATAAAARDLLELNKKQEKHLNTLSSKVMQTLCAYTTVAKLRNDCPQFDKYLPNEAAINYPVAVVGSPIPDLMLAGWPKGKTP